MYSELQHTVEIEFNDSGEKMLVHAAGNHRQQLDMMQEAADTVFTAYDFQPFSLPDNPVKGQTIIRRLDEMASLNQYYDTVVLHFHQNDFIYTHSTSMHLDRFLNAGLLYEGIDTEELMQLMNGQTKFRMIPQQRVNGSILTKPYCVSYLYSMPRKHGATVFFLADCSTMRKLLAPTDNHLLIMWQDDIVFSTADQPIEAGALHSAMNAKQPIIRLDDSEYRLFFSSDDEYSLTYCLLRSLDHLRAGMRTNICKIMLFAVIMSIPATFIASCFSVRFSRKIRRIHRILLPDDSVEDSLDGLESSAIAVMKRSREMVGTIRENLNYQRDRFVKETIQRGFSSREALREAAELVQLQFAGPLYSVMLSNFSKDDNISEPVLSDPLFSETAWGVRLTAYSQILYLINAGDEAQMEEQWNRLADHLRSRNANDVIAVSSVKNDPALIPSAFLEAQTAYDSRFLLDTNQLLRFDRMKENTTVQPYPDNLLDMLKAAIRLRSESQISDSLKKILQYAKTSCMSMLSFRLMYNDMIRILVQEYANMSAEQDIQQVYNAFSLSHCLSVQELNDMLRDICLLLIREEQQTASVSERMQRIAQYIQEHFHESDITMGRVAELHQISSVAISLQFKETFGMSPSDYLSMLRMQQAQKMLTNTDLSVKEIGARVGYSDFPHFLRRFKAYTAMTPSQYRNASRTEHEQEE